MPSYSWSTPGGEGHKLEALQTVPTSSWGLQIDGGGTVYLSAGDCYLSSPAPGGTEGLMTKLATLLSATVASTTVTLVVSGGVGRVRITWGSGTHDIVWVSTTLRDRLGFDDNTDTEAVSDAVNQPMGCWLPIGFPSDLLASYSSIGSRESDKVTHVARSGKVYSTGYNTRRKQRFGWNGQTKEKTWKADETVVNQSFERFWEDFLSQGVPFRWYQGTGTTGYQNDDSENRDYYDVSPNFNPEAMRRSFDGSWRWTLDCVEYV
jgi:hypothetical protein